MANNISHFAINADDVSRARRFYERAFGWKFHPWGPPDFYKITTGPDDNPGVGGAIQKRRELLPGQPMVGFECTIGVESIDRAIEAVETNGGTIIIPKFEIPGVGVLIFFRDTEGNAVGAMHYTGDAR